MRNTSLMLRPWFAAHTPQGRKDASERTDIDSFFRSMFDGLVAPWENMCDVVPFWKHQQAGLNIMPNLDLTSDQKAYALSVELPGVEPDDVKLEVQENALVLSGEKKVEKRDEATQHVLERSYGSFRRVLSLPEDADVEHIAAASKNGVLTVTIPRKAPEKPAARTINIDRA